MPQMHFSNGAFTLHCPVVGGARLEDRSSIELSNLAANQGGASAWVGTSAHVLPSAYPTPNQRCATGRAPRPRHNPLEKPLLQHHSAVKRGSTWMNY